MNRPTPLRALDAAHFGGSVLGFRRAGITCEIQIKIPYTSFPRNLYTQSSLPTFPPASLPTAGQWYTVIKEPRDK